MMLSRAVAQGVCRNICVPKAVLLTTADRLCFSLCSLRLPWCPLPCAPGSQLKVGSPTNAPVPLWSQAPPTTGSAVTPGWSMTPGAAPWGTTPGTAQAPFWHNTPSGGVQPTMWPE